MRSRNPVLLSMSQLLRTKKRKGTSHMTRKCRMDRGREQPDPDELRRRVAEASADAAGARPTMMGGVGSASAETRRPNHSERPARPVDRRTRRQRVARTVVQLRALVAMTGKTVSTQCWGCNVVNDGGGFCDECITELQKQCVQDDVMLASYAAELARTVGTANAGDAYDIVSGPSLDHRDDVEQLMGHQAVAYVTKIFDTNEAILTESGRRESLKEYIVLREKAVQCWLVDHEQMAHCYRSTSSSRVVARWGRCWCDQACVKSQRVCCGRGASWTKRACEGSRDVLGRTVACRMVEDCRICLLNQCYVVAQWSHHSLIQ